MNFLKDCLHIKVQNILIHAGIEVEHNSDNNFKQGIKK